MQNIFQRDAHRLLVAPFLGLLAGFLVNRAREGSIGLAMLSEMVLGALTVTVAAVLLARLRGYTYAQAQARRAELLEVEAERYAAELELRAQMIAPASLGAELVRAHERIERLEAENRAAQQARERLLTIEAAQDALRRESIEMGQRATQEAEELKASLRLAISDSQRQRNMHAPENDQSGRIIELEARIRRLAREIERLSERQVAAPSGASVAVAAGGSVPNQARIGFLRAMLDANKTLREQIKEAA
jgi:hypothetical protein